MMTYEEKRIVRLYPTTPVIVIEQIVGVTRGRVKYVLDKYKVKRRTRAENDELLRTYRKPKRAIDLNKLITQKWDRELRL